MCIPNLCSILDTIPNAYAIHSMCGDVLVNFHCSFPLLMLLKVGQKKSVKFYKISKISKGY